MGSHLRDRRPDQPAGLFIEKSLSSGTSSYSSASGNLEEGQGRRELSRSDDRAAAKSNLHAAYERGRRRIRRDPSCAPWRRRRSRISSQTADFRVEAQVLEILAELMSGSLLPVVPVSEIATGLIERYGSEYDRPITNRWVGSILRKRLNTRTYKSHGVYAAPMQECSKTRAFVHTVWDQRDYEPRSGI